MHHSTCVENRKTVVPDQRYLSPPAFPNDPRRISLGIPPVYKFASPLPGYVSMWSCVIVHWTSAFVQAVVWAHRLDAFALCCVKNKWSLRLLTYCLITLIPRLPVAFARLHVPDANAFVPNVVHFHDYSFAFRLLFVRVMFPIVLLLHCCIPIADVTHILYTSVYILTYCMSGNCSPWTW